MAALLAVFREGKNPLAKLLRNDGGFLSLCLAHAPGIRNKEGFARGKKKVEEDVAVVVPAVAVAPSGEARHQVELLGVRRPGES